MGCGKGLVADQAASDPWPHAVNAFFGTNVSKRILVQTMVIDTYLLLARNEDFEDMYARCVVSETLFSVLV